MVYSNSSNSSQQCMSCGNINTPDSNFCKKCGTKLSSLKVCPRCEKSIDIDSFFCSHCGLSLSTMPTLHERKAHIKTIVDKLRETGIDNLVAQILKVLKEEYPRLTPHNFPQEFFDVFWAREYGIVPEMIYDNSDELIIIKTQVEGRVRLENFQILVDEQRKEKGEQQKQRQQEELTHKQQRLQADIEFQKKNVDELAEEAWSYVDQLRRKNLRDFVLAESRYDLDLILRGFWQEHYRGLYGLDGLSEMKKSKVTDVVYARWQKEQFDAYYRSLSQDEKEKAHALKEFVEKTPEKLAEEIISIFEMKEYWPALFDHSSQGRRKAIFQNFESKVFIPPLDKISWTQYPKLRDVRNLVEQKLPEVEKRIFENILEECSRLARGKSSITQGELDDIFTELGLRDTPGRFKKELYHDINRRLSSSKT